MTSHNQRTHVTGSQAGIKADHAHTGNTRLYARGGSGKGGGGHVCIPSIPELLV